MCIHTYIQMYTYNACFRADDTIGSCHSTMLLNIAYQYFAMPVAIQPFAMAAVIRRSTVKEIPPSQNSMRCILRRASLIELCLLSGGGYLQLLVVSEPAC